MKSQCNEIKPHLVFVLISLPTLWSAVLSALFSQNLTFEQDQVGWPGFILKSVSPSLSLLQHTRIYEVCLAAYWDVIPLLIRVSEMDLKNVP